MDVKKFEDLVPVNGSGYDELLNELQGVLYDAAHQGYEEYKNTLDAYYATPESRTGETIAETQKNAIAEWNKKVYDTALSYLKKQYPDVLVKMQNGKWWERIQCIETYKGKDIAGNLFISCIWSLTNEAYKYLNIEITCSLARLTTNLRTIHRDVLRKHWKGIRILPTSVDTDGNPPSRIGSYRTYRLYDEELQFTFVLYPDDNYYHWGTYEYGCSDENAPKRYKTRVYDYDDIPEIALRI